MLSAKMATIFLNAIGVNALQAGSAIHVGPGYEVPLDVADPCSGLRSLLAMTALTAVYAYSTQKTLVKKWLLFSCSIPLAVLGNIGRITTIAVMSQAVGKEIALGVYHDFSGYILFTVSISMMVALGVFFNIGFRELFRKWKTKIISLTS
jgi:exosortase